MPLGCVHVAPPSLVMMAEAPFCAMANQVLRVVAASPVSTKNGNHDTPPAGQPAPDVNFQVSPPSVDSAILSASWKPVMRCVASRGSTTIEQTLESSFSGSVPVSLNVSPPSVDLKTLSSP